LRIIADVTHTTINTTRYVRNVAVPHRYCCTASAGSLNGIAKRCVHKVRDAASGTMLVVARIRGILLSREHLEEAVTATRLCHQRIQQHKEHDDRHDFAPSMKTTAYSRLLLAKCSFLYVQTHFDIL
jgi:hypothetical protein